jgi:hypothetical protein
VGIGDHQLFAADGQPDGVTAGRRILSIAIREAITRDQESCPMTVNAAPGSSSTGHPVSLKLA